MFLVGFHNGLRPDTDNQARRQGLYRVHVHPPHLMKRSAQSDQIRQNKNNQKEIK